MSESEGSSCCKCCCSLIFTLGLTSLFLWLSLRTSKPKFVLEKFYVPSLNQTLNTTLNSTLVFELKLINTNKDIGVFYDNVSVAFFDSPVKNHTIGNYTIPSFYQGHDKKAKKGGLVQTAGIDRTAVFRAVSVNQSAVFRVDLATSVRYKVVFWKTKREKIKVGAYLPVNDQGTKVNPKGIKLTSSGISVVVGGQFGAFLAGLFVVVVHLCFVDADII